MTPERTPSSSRGPGLALIGYRGTGKSTVGRILANRLNRTFRDCDPEIEARAGRPIRAIFAESGELAFRDWEERTLAELTSGNPAIVLATGGGAVLREINRHRLRAFGFVVWLTAQPSELARRLRADPRGLAERPALTPVGTLEEIVQVLEARAPLYLELADAVVETGEKSPDEVADAILESWKPLQPRGNP